MKNSEFLLGLIALILAFSSSTTFPTPSNENIKENEEEIGIGIGTLGTIISVIGKGYDLYRKFQGDRDKAKGDIQHNEIINYFKKVESEIGEITRQNVQVFNAIKQNEALSKKILDKVELIDGELKLINQRITGLQESRLNTHIENIVTTMELIKEADGNVKEQKKIFEESKRSFRISLYFLYKEEYRLEYLLKLPMYTDFLLVYTNPKYLEKGYYTQKTDTDAKWNITNKLKDRVYQLVHAAQIQQNFTTKYILETYFNLGRTYEEGAYINQGEWTGEGVTNITDFTKKINAHINLPPNISPHDDVIANAADKAETYLIKLPELVKQSNALNQVAGALMLYYENL